MLTDDDIERSLGPLRAGALRAPFAGSWLAPPFPADGADRRSKRATVARDGELARFVVDRATSEVFVVDGRGEEVVASSPDALARRAGLYTAALVAGGSVDPGDGGADVRLAQLARVLLDQLGKADPGAGVDGFWSNAAEELGSGLFAGAPPGSAPPAAERPGKPGVLVALTPAESDAFFPRETWHRLAGAAHVRVVSAPQRLGATLEAIELLDAQRGRTTPTWRVLVTGPSSEAVDRLPDGLLPAGCVVVDVRGAGPDDVLAAAARAS